MEKISYQKAWKTILYFVSISMVQWKHPGRQKFNLFSTVFWEIFNYVSQLFRPDGSIKTWHELKTEHELHENSYFQWLQQIKAIPEGWKSIIKGTHESTTNLIIHDHHVIKGSRILTLDKLSSTKIYASYLNLSEIDLNFKSSKYTFL